MINCAVVFDGQVSRAVFDDTHQQLLGFCVKYGQIAVVVFKNSFRNEGTAAEMG